MKANFKVIAFYAVLILVTVIVGVTLLRNMDRDELVYSDVLVKFENGEVTEFVVTKDNVLVFKTTDGREYNYQLRDLNLFYNDLSETVHQQILDETIKTADYEPPTTWPAWIMIVPYIIVLVVIVGIFIYFANSVNGKNGRGGGMSFGRAKAKLGTDDKKRVYFTDVAGCDEEKEELREVVDYLKDPKKFTRLGARIPKGVLLVGPPGTGKTLLAKAVAGEAGVPFYSLSGSDFVEMYVGVGASRVRDLFETARKNTASIVFIDEIDAVGRHRGAGLGGGHDEREQTLNQLLVEMDGFGTHEGVIVMAATNRPDILDPALLRPGRFDRQVTVHYPDLQGREDILRVHARNKPLEADVDLKEIARTTIGFTGADLANLLNEAALLAARKNKSLIGMTDIEEASIKLIVGTAKKTKRRSEFETKMTAYHEAGHAIAHFALETLDPVQQISIIPTARTGGYTLSAPVADHYYMSRKHMREEIVALLGGRVAEMLIFSDLSTGASNDIQRATDIARDMVTKYGMSDKLGSVVYGSGHGDDEVFLGRDFSSSKNYSDATATEIDNEIRAIVDGAYEQCSDILNKYMDKLHFIAEYLIRFEIMDAAQFKAVMEGNPTIEELEEMVAEKRRKSEEENRIRRENEEAARRQDEENRLKREAEEKKNGDPADNNPVSRYQSEHQDGDDRRDNGAPPEDQN